MTFQVTPKTMMASRSNDRSNALWVEIVHAPVSSFVDKSKCMFLGCTYNMVNSSVKQAATCAQSPDNEHEKIKQKILLPLTILILVTNIVVLLFIATNKRFHTPTYMFIASLGVSDLFVGFDSIVALSTKANEKSLDMCLSRMGCNITALSASAWSLTCVAADRYVAVIKALRYKAIMTKQKTAFGITFSWLVSMAIGLLPLMGWTDKAKTYQQYCSFMFVLSNDYIMFAFVFSAILPLTTMFVIYGILFKNARSHLKLIFDIEKLQTDKRKTIVLGISSRNLRSLKTFAAVLGCVFVTWVPPIIITVCDIASGNKNCTLQEIIGTHFLVLRFSNSFLNPLIYVLTTKDFRTKVAQTIRRRCHIADSHVFPSNANARQNYGICSFSHPV